MNKKQSDSVSREEVSGWLKIFPQDPNCTLTHESTLALALSYIRLLDSSEQTIAELRDEVNISRVLLKSCTCKYIKSRTLACGFAIDSQGCQLHTERDTLRSQLAQAQKDTERHAELVKYLLDQR